MIFLVGCLESQKGSPTFCDVDKIVTCTVHNIKNTTKFISLLLLVLWSYKWWWVTLCIAMAENQELPTPFTLLSCVLNTLGKRCKYTTMTCIANYVWHAYCSRFCLHVYSIYCIYVTAEDQTFPVYMVIPYTFSNNPSLQTNATKKEQSRSLLVWQDG